RGGRGRGGGVVRGKGDAVKGGRGIGKGTNMRGRVSRGGTVTGSRLIDEIDVDETGRGEGIETSRAATVGANAGSSKPGKTLGLRVRRGIGKRNVVAENVRHDSIFQMIALKLWSANSSIGNYSCRERHAFVRFPNVLMQLRLENLSLQKKPEKIAGLPKMDCL
ncbi:hypothetical protein Tco_0958879, partial [Tanacetum coccineum]